MSLKDKVLEYLQSDRRCSHFISELKETVYFTPITVIDMEKLLALSRNGADTRAFHIMTVIEKAEDEEGKKLFGVEDRPYIEKLPWKLVTGLTNAIHNTDRVDDLKNLRTDSYRRNLFALADRKRCFLGDLKRLTVSELNEWIAFYELEADELEEIRAKT